MTAPVTLRWVGSDPLDPADLKPRPLTLAACLCFALDEAVTDYLDAWHSCLAANLALGALLAAAARIAVAAAQQKGAKLVASVEPPRVEEPPSDPPDAWCIRCGGPTRQGPRGCVACAAEDDELEREGRLS